MAIGTTADFVLKRWEIIESAYRKCRALKPGRQLSHEQLVFGTRDLNLIIRQESHIEQRRKHLYALSTDYIIMIADQHIYDNTDIPSDIERIEHAWYRTNGGDDTPIKILDKKTYDAIPNKDERGEPTAIYFERDITLANRKIRIYPALDSITTASEVAGSASGSYVCVMKHTSATLNRPTSGDGWELYWKSFGTSVTAWAAATAYVQTEVIGFTYRRPLADFDLPTDNPDMPLGWDLYLIYKLASHLAIDVGLSSREIDDLKSFAHEAETELFPSTGSATEEVHNKGTYF